MELLRINQEVFKHNIEHKEKVQIVNEFLLNLGVDFAQFKEGGLIRGNGNRDILFVADNGEDILTEHEIRQLESYLSCSIKFTSSLIS